MPAPATSRSPTPSPVRGRTWSWSADGCRTSTTFDGPARGVACAKPTVAEAASGGLSVRAGLNVGEVEIHSDDVSGLAVHIASRVTALSGGAQVLVSSTVRDLIAGSGIDL